MKVLIYGVIGEIINKNNEINYKLYKWQLY